MLCERCQTREANIHRTLVAWPGDKVTNSHFCKSCYNEVEAENLRASHPREDTPAPPIEDVEHITASEYLEAEARARKNASDKPAFKHIINELERFPRTRSRMAFEFLDLAQQTLERGEHPGFLTAVSGMFWNSAEPERAEEYATSVEKLMRRLFELLGRSATPEQARAHSPSSSTPSLLWSMVFAALALRRVDHDRYMAVANDLKAECDRSGLKGHRNVIAQVEERVRRIERSRG